MTARTRGGLRERFGIHVRRSGLLRGRSRILVALSGGLDSVVLLHLLRHGDVDVDLVAAHLDHAMRQDSAADALWVRGLCRAWEIPLHTARVEDAPRSEAAARAVRYEFLLSVAAAGGAAAIATAHHADDQAETVLFRLARGTGVTGLAGIPERRGMIVRPLLPFTRAELEAYAHAQRIGWREDASNLDLRFARNRIRHLVLAPLERARPGATRRIAAIARDAAAAERLYRRVLRRALDDVVVERSASGFVLARQRLLAYDPHVRARVLRHLSGRLGSRPDRAGTRFALAFITSGASGGAIELAGGVLLEREFDRLLVRPARSGRVADVPLRIEEAGSGTGVFVAGGRTYTARWAPAGQGAADGWAATFDPSSLRFPLELRGWCAGDRVRLAYGSKKLKKLFQERRIGRTRRAAVPVLSDAAGDILWVVGVVRSDRAPAERGSLAFEITVVDGDTD